MLGYIRNRDCISYPDVGTFVLIRPAQTFYERIKLPKRQQDQAKLMLRTIPYAPTRTEAERLRTVFTRWCGDHSYEAASEALERDWDHMVTFYDFPKEHWEHLRTTNPVESPFAALRLRTDAAKRYKRVDRAIAVIWKMLMVAEQRFRRLKAPELIEDAYLGAQYADGIAIESTAERRSPPDVVYTPIDVTSSPSIVSRLFSRAPPEGPFLGVPPRRPPMTFGEDPIIEWCRAPSRSPEWKRDGVLEWRCPRVRRHLHA